MNYKDLTSINRIGILGGSGSGKSNSAYVIIKELRKKKMPVWILDSTNDYGDLLDTGLFKEFRAHKLSAPLLAKKLRRTHHSAIISFNRMKDLTDKRNYIASFIEECFNKKNKYPATVVIDEVHRFVPQKESKDKTVKRCKYWVNQLLSDGRKHGYGSLIISQRASKIDKDSLAEVDNLLVHKHTLARDIRSLRDQLGEFEENIGINIKKEIPQFRKGEGYLVDFEDFVLDKVRMPLDKTKKLGRTPMARGVVPKRETFKDRLKDIETGIEEDDIKLAVTVIIIFSLIMLSLGVLFSIHNDEMLNSD